MNIQEQFDTINGRFDDTDNRLKFIAGKLGIIDRRLNDIDGRLDIIEENIRENGKLLKEIVDRLPITA